MFAKRKNALVGEGIFVPGWGAPALLYRHGLPTGWTVLELPSFREARGTLDRHRACVRAALAGRREPVALAGHSLGAALAVLAAAETPDAVSALVLVSPAGLPLAKPLTASALTLARQILQGAYPAWALARKAAAILSAPRATLALARVAHDLDVSRELAAVRAHGTPCTVVAARSDRLTTCEHCRRVAELLGCEYRELDARDGHIWPITQPELLRRELERLPPATPARLAS
jgi:pimeloyl-ACP methyl ester carboxylesterase